MSMMLEIRRYEPNVLMYFVCLFKVFRRRLKSKRFMCLTAIVICIVILIVIAVILALRL